MVARHNIKEIFAWSSPVSDQLKYWKKIIICLFKFFKKLLNRQNELKLNHRQPKICSRGFDRLFKKEIICHRSTWLASDVFGRSSHHSGQTLSSGWPLFWAPKSVSLFSKRCFACTQPSSQAGLKPTSSSGLFSSCLWEWQEEERPGSLGTRLVSSQTSQQCHFKNCEWGLYTQAV